MYVPFFTYSTIIIHIKEQRFGEPVKFKICNTKYEIVSIYMDYKIMIISQYVSNMQAETVCGNILTD